MPRGGVLQAPCELYNTRAQLAAIQVGRCLLSACLSPLEPATGAYSRLAVMRMRWQCVCSDLHTHAILNSATQAVQ